MEYDGKIAHKVPSCLTPNSSLYEAPYVFPGRFMCVLTRFDICAQTSELLLHKILCNIASLLLRVKDLK